MTPVDRAAQRARLEQIIANDDRDLASRVGMELAMGAHDLLDDLDAAEAEIARLREARRRDGVRITGEVLGAFSQMPGPLAWTDAELAFLRGLYDDRWPTGNQTFDRVAVALARQLGLLETP